MTEPRLPTRSLPGGRAAWLGVAAVAALLGIATVTGVVRGRETPPLDRANAALAEVTPMPRAAPDAPGPDLSGMTPAAAAEAAYRDAWDRWDTALAASDAVWPRGTQPLPRAALEVLTRAKLPRGMAYVYGVETVVADSVLDVTGARDVVSRNAREVDASARTRLAVGLRRQTACLTGVSMGAVYGARVLTPARVESLMDIGLVRGSRDPGLDAEFLRGSRSGDPAVCRIPTG